jgi:hypothetical protein
MSASEVRYALPCSRSWEKEDFMKNLTLTSLTIGFSVALMVGCGGGGGINSGVDESKPASEVTDDEAEAVCEATADYAASKIDEQELNCRTVALYAGSLSIADGDEAMQEACDTAYDACLEVAPEEPEETDCSDATADTAGCDDTVTVGQVQTCLEDTVDAGAAAADQLPTCAELTVEYLEDAEENPPELPEDPASCEDVYEACPGFATDD